MGWFTVTVTPVSPLVTHLEEPMSQSPPPPSGQQMPNGRPRPGAQAAPGTPGFQHAPEYVDYGSPRLYDTTNRPASGLTAARYAPAPMQRPQQAQPESAWATQARSIQEIHEAGKQGVPGRTIAAWIIAGVLGIGVLIVLGIGFLAFILQGQANPAWWLTYAFIAFLSLLVIAGVVLIADRWDPEPVPMLLTAVFWGAAIAVSIAFVVNSTFGALAGMLLGPNLGSLLTGVVCAPITEETAKGLGLVLIFLIARRHFTGPLDGLIYGALIGGGFAFVENILYYTRSVTDYIGQGADVGQTVFGSTILVVVRGVIGIFGHCIYTSLTGVVMGLVARKWGTLPGVLIFVVATWPGIFLHGLWNGGSGLLGSMFGLGGLLIALVGEVIESAIWLALILLLVWDEARLTRVRLGDYANLGWLTHEEVTMLATWKGRREGKRWARSIGAGPTMKTFIRESAELASTRQRLLADGGNPRAIQHERELLGRLTANRQALLHAAPAG